MQPVLIAHNEPDDFRDLLAERFPDLGFVYATTAEEVVEGLRAHDPEAVFSIKHPGSPDPVHAPISRHPSVRWIQVGGSGFDHLAPWDAGRITVTNGAGVLAPYLAESVTGAMLALACGFPNYAAQQRERRWRPVSFTPLRGGPCSSSGSAASGSASRGTRRPSGCGCSRPGRRRPRIRPRTRCTARTRSPGSSPGRTSCRSTSASTRRRAGSSPARRSRP